MVASPLPAPGNGLAKPGWKLIRSSGASSKGPENGEEFIIVAPETDLKEMQAVAEKIRRAIQNHRPANAPAATASPGVTQYTPGEELQILIQRADQAL